MIDLLMEEKKPIRPAFVMVGDKTPLIDQLKETFKEKYKAYFFTTTSSDEVDQIGRQVKKIVIVFEDPSLCSKFLDDEVLAATSFLHKSYLIFKETSSLDEALKRKLENKEIKYYLSDSMTDFVNDLEGFFEKKE